jgi:hypothetical protein
VRGYVGIVRDATDEYFAEQTLQQWLDDCTADGGQFAFSRTAELFASWKAQSRQRISMSAFGLSGPPRFTAFRGKTEVALTLQHVGF